MLNSCYSSAVVGKINYFHVLLYSYWAMNLDTVIIENFAIIFNCCNLGKYAHECISFKSHLPIMYTFIQNNFQLIECLGSIQSIYKVISWSNLTRLPSKNLLRFVCFFFRTGSGNSTDGLIRLIESGPYPSRVIYIDTRYP